MSNTKTVMGQASNQYVKPLDITDVFSTYLYTGTASARTITNDIDLAGEGGLVWTKGRSVAYSHSLVDTERGGSSILFSNGTNSENAGDVRFSSFNSDGYSLALSAGGNFDASGEDYASWTFRKAPKFFDVVTFTSASSGNTTFSHDLGTEPAFVVIKNTQTSDPWIIYHRSTGTTKLLAFTTSAAGEQGAGTFTATSTDFTVASNLMYTSQTYVAYLFAHNDGDGGFGPDGDQDIIKCGSYTGNGSTTGVFQDLGFEPQWIMCKVSSSTDGWILLDNMRGVTGGNDPRLEANTSGAEANGQIMEFNSTGFTPLTADGKINGSGKTYIYMAIRRGPLAPPESGTEVFDMSYNGEGDPNTSPRYESTTMSYVDMGISTNITGDNKKVGDRLRQGKELITNLTNSEANEANHNFDYQGGYFTGTGTSTNNRAWMWKRAPGFFDVVAYTGDGVAGRTVSHNLGVAPEMMWVKRRDLSSNWSVYAAPLGNGYLQLNSTNAYSTTTDVWNNTAPTSGEFTLAGGGWEVNDSGYNFIAYLFATLPGVSKVFSVTKSSGSDASVDCGFTSGPRFVMLKRTDSTGDWYVWDTERGIVAGNDPYLLLNSTAAEVTSTDYIDPTSNGFTIVNGGLADGDYIGYAVS